MKTTTRAAILAALLGIGMSAPSVWAQVRPGTFTVLRAVNLLVSDQSSFTSASLAGTLLTVQNTATAGSGMIIYGAKSGGGGNSLYVGDGNLAELFRITPSATPITYINTLTMIGGSGFSLNFDRTTNGAGTGSINSVGYLDSTTQFRDLSIKDGKGTQVLLVSGQGNAKGWFLPDGYNGNVGFTSYPGRATTNPTNAINLLAGTSPVGAAGGGANMGTIYAQNDAGAGEIYVMDEGGTATKISPHDPLSRKWIFDSTDTPTGRKLRVEMEDLVKYLDAQFGTHYVSDSRAYPKAKSRIRSLESQVKALDARLKKLEGAK